jgi:hypothetical protein
MTLLVQKPTGGKLLMQKPTGAKLLVRSTWEPADTDAAAYIAAVEAADGQALEERTRKAIDDFVIGCKADGIWTAIKASCILAGARTLTGALVPLVGAAPTNFNFVSGDYNRKTGLVGDGSTKYLNSNRLQSADPQGSVHHAVYVASASASTYTGPVVNTVNNAGSMQLVTTGARNRNITIDATAPQVTGASFVGTSRASSAGFTWRGNGVTYSFTRASQTPLADNTSIFGAKGSNVYTSDRLAFYSIGESLNLTLLDTRVTALVNAFAAAIP